MNHLPPVVHLKLWISQQIFENSWNGAMVESGDWGKMTHASWIEKSRGIVPFNTLFKVNTLHISKNKTIKSEPGKRIEIGVEIWSLFCYWTSWVITGLLLYVVRTFKQQTVWYTMIQEAFKCWGKIYNKKTMLSESFTKALSVDVTGQLSFVTPSPPPSVSTPPPDSKYVRQVISISANPPSVVLTGLNIRNFSQLTLLSQKYCESEIFQLYRYHRHWFASL